jgi:hypothetical protein
MNTATLTAPRAAPSTSPQPLQWFWIVAWLAIGIAITTLVEFDWTQDIAAYADNLEVQADYDPGSLKAAWYLFLVYPLLDLLDNADYTLAALKAIIFSLFFVSQRKAFKTNLDCFLFISVLLLTPALAKNMTEYLRQGTALGIFLLAMSFPRRLVSIPLTVVAAVTHFVVALPVMAVCGAWVAKFFEPKKRSLLVFLPPLFLPGAALIFGLFGGGIISALAPDQVQDYLSGSRSNILGLLYLAFFAFYTGVQFSIFRSKAHLPVFIMFLVITASYSVLLNFGRTMAIVMPLHLAAALTLPTARSRYIDLLFVFTAGTAFAFAGSEG